MIRSSALTAAQDAPAAGSDSSAAAMDRDAERLGGREAVATVVRDDEDDLDVEHAVDDGAGRDNGRDRGV